MSFTRQLLISLAVFLAVPPAVVRGASDTVEYIGGSVKSIPVHTTGTFSLPDSKELQFTYGASVYKLPYEQITGTEIVKGEGRRILHKIPVPSIPGRSKETLSIIYKDATGVVGTLNFELSSREANWTRDTIAARKATPQAAAAAANPSEWWGDRYWKTNRNKGAWEGTAQTAQPAPAPQPAPAAQPAPAPQPAPTGPGGTK